MDIIFILFGIAGLTLTIIVAIKRIQEGYFAPDAYAQGLYDYPEQTKDDLVLALITAFSSSAAFLVVGVWWLISDIKNHKKNNCETK